MEKNQNAPGGENPPSPFCERGPRTEDEEFLHKLYIKRKLDEAEASASNPDTKWLSEDEFWSF